MNGENNVQHINNFCFTRLSFLQFPVGDKGAKIIIFTLVCSLRKYVFLLVLSRKCFHMFDVCLSPLNWFCRGVAPSLLACKCAERRPPLILAKYMSVTPPQPNPCPHSAILFPPPGLTSPRRHAGASSSAPDYSLTNSSKETTSNCYETERNNLRH